MVSSRISLPISLQGECKKGPIRGNWGGKKHIFQWGRYLMRSSKLLLQFGIQLLMTQYFLGPIIICSWIMASQISQRRWSWLHIVTKVILQRVVHLTSSQVLFNLGKIKQVQRLLSSLFLSSSITFICFMIISKVSSSFKTQSI